MFQIDYPVIMHVFNINELSGIFQRIHWMCFKSIIGYVSNILPGMFLSNATCF